MLIRFAFVAFCISLAFPISGAAENTISLCLADTRQVDFDETVKATGMALGGGAGSRGPMQREPL